MTGKYNSKDINELISYEEELKNGKYRDMKKIYDYYGKMGINKI